jgi:hypothetical protein
MMGTAATLAAICFLGLSGFSAQAEYLSHSEFGRLRILAGLPLEKNNMSARIENVAMKVCGYGPGDVEVQCEENGNCCRAGIQLWCCPQGHACNYDKAGCED